MFDRISGRYDLLNHVLSFNLDRRWRRAVIRELPDRDADTVLDLCGGTGDLTVELARAGRGRLVVCCDFSHPMLARAARKLRDPRVDGRCVLLQADGLALPLPDSSVDAATVAFGVRNFADMPAGFREIHRVLRPGGRLVVLEFSRPTAPVLKGLYRFYLRRVLPHVGTAVSGRSGPYAYLASTISDFPEPDVLAGIIRESGFAACGWNLLSGGIVATHVAIKAPASASGSLRGFPRATAASPRRSDAAEEQ